jgi:hypothetical protein
LVVIPPRLLWPKYSSNRSEAQRLDFLAKSANDLEIVRWIDNNYIDPSFDIDLPDVENDRDQDLGNYKNEIGFLFVCLKNDDAITRRNTFVIFNKANLASTVPAITDPGANSFKVLKTVFQDKGDPETYLTRGDIEYSEREEYLIPRWEKGVSFLFLISVYRADVEGFENGFLDNVYQLDAIYQKKLVTRPSVPIRRPSREKAIREKIPYGWFRQ